METELESLLDAALRSYHATVGDMAKYMLQAYPPLGYQLQTSLLECQEGLKQSASTRPISETEKEIRCQLQQWSQAVSSHFKRKADEVKEIILLVARSAQSAGERDERYVQHMNQLTERLQATADLEDLTEIRQSVLQRATELRDCAQNLREDGREAVLRLRKELEVYETRLREVELLVSRDPLTGIDNRRELEIQLERRIAAQRPFSVAVFDLIGFKAINDRYGHVAGDELLKKFSSELRARFRATDVIGRWGGDEFIAIIDCELNEAKTRVEGVCQWALGTYVVKTGADERSVNVTASIGIAAWHAGESALEVLARADAAMYQEKTAQRLQRR